MTTSKYFKERRLQENELFVSIVDTDKRKKGDFLKVAYISREYGIDFLVGYDYHKKKFSECRHKKLLEQTRSATQDEIKLFLKGKINING